MSHFQRVAARTLRSKRASCIVCSHLLRYSVYIYIYKYIYHHDLLYWQQQRERLIVLTV
jgi:hypothetical protein